MNVINFDRLKRELLALRNEFHREPFNYLVIEDFLHVASADQVLTEFPEITQDWVDARGLSTQNKWIQPIVSTGSAGAFYQEVNSPEFLNWLSELTNIPDVLEDPDLSGAGYLQTTDGGYLNVHVDFN